MTYLDCLNKTGHHWGNECTNPEHASSNLTITKVELLVDGNMSSIYGKCNVCTNGTTPLSKHPKPCAYGEYVCECSIGSMHTNETEVPCPPNVGYEHVKSTFNFPLRPGMPRTIFWMENLVKKTAGTWYSTVKTGECAAEDRSPTAGRRADGAPCYWRIAATKRKVAFACQQSAMYAAVRAADKAACFSACAQPKNTSSPCAIDCLYATLLGADGGGVIDPTGGMTGKEIVALWTDAFDGCPNLLSSDARRST